MKPVTKMKFNSTVILLAVSFVLIFSCKGKSDSQETISEITQSPSITHKTYAEISVKKGGEWEGTEYVGGTFSNVEEITLPEEHTDHSYYIRYEGPGWENAQVGYRLYLDWRNAIDIFGKKTDSMILPQVGQDGFDSYHKMAPWGMDILKAGSSLGIGSYGRFMNDTVAKFRNIKETHAKVSNFNNGSEVQVTYNGWITGSDTINLVSTFSIYPEDRFTKVKLKPSAPLEGLTTGFVKFDDIELIGKLSEDGSWGYIATYGAQTLVDEMDQLGMAIFYKISEVDEVTEGPHDHLVVFKNSNEELTYYFLAAWEKEPEGLKTRDDFFADLDSKLISLEEKGHLEK